MCGHGMGAALACRVGIAVKRKINKSHNCDYNDDSNCRHRGMTPSLSRQLRQRDDGLSLSEEESFIDSNIDNVRVYAYGLPSCLPTTANEEDDDDYSHIVTSIVNNHDCIPRLTASNLSILQKLLRWTE